MNIFKWLCNRQYRIFRKKMKDVDVAMWESEFKIAKSKQVRENVRQDRDRALEAVIRLDQLIKEEIDNEKLVELVKEKDTLNDNAVRFEKQMKMIDEQITGGTPSEMNPSGVGIMEQLRSMAELKEMYKDYARNI